VTYAEKLRDPRWQRRRLEIMNRDGFKCAECHNTRRTLNVHHKWYDRGVSPWAHSDECLVTLCEECHKTRTLVDDDARKVMGQLTRAELLNLMEKADQARNAVDVSAAWTPSASRQLERADAIKGELMDLLAEMALGVG
jgi:5-methylcytosine-specific restriction endonuclease McrA